MRSSPVQVAIVTSSNRTRDAEQAVEEMNRATPGRWVSAPCACTQAEADCAGCRTCDDQGRCWKEAAPGSPPVSDTEILRLYAEWRAQRGAGPS